MDSKDIIVYVLVFVLAGFSLYRRYIKKKQSGNQTAPKNPGPMASSSSKDDDYEPYLKK